MNINMVQNRNKVFSPKRDSNYIFVLLIMILGAFILIVFHLRACCAFRWIFEQFINLFLENVVVHDLIVFVTTILPEQLPLICGTICIFGSFLHQALSSLSKKVFIDFSKNFWYNKIEEEKNK